VHVVSLDNVKFSSASIPNAPANKAPAGRGGNPRMESITDLAFEDGRILVAGLSNEEFSSSLRSIPFPFSTIDQGASIEMFHGAHGRLETASPVRAFVPYSVGGESHLLLANNNRGIMKITTDGIANITPITNPVKGGGSEGLAYETQSAGSAVGSSQSTRLQLR
jgi:hypothetical protein